MFRLSKATQHALAAMSFLAERHGDGAACTSVEISRARHLPKPVVAKTLTVLSQAGLVTGTPGPRGGYRLIRPPREIHLLEVVERFEREPESACPYGPGWCGVGAPCPLHDSMVTLQQVVRDYLARTSFDVFRHTSRPEPGPGEPSAGSGPVPGAAGA